VNTQEDITRDPACALRSWRIVEWATTATISVPEVGPWRPNPHTNDGHLRGACAGAAWGWRGSDGVFHWEDGDPPARVGVLCDATWRPYTVRDLPNLVQPFGGFSRSMANRLTRGAVEGLA
jgi:hypothetical protein